MDGMSRLLLHKIQKSIVFQWAQMPWCGLLLPAHILATYGWVSESVGGVLKGWRVELWHIWACCQKPPWWSENIGAVCSWWVHNAGKWQWQSRMGSRGWAAIAEEGCWSWFSSEWCHFLNSGMAWRSRSTAWIWKRLWQILDWQAFCKAGKNTQSITGNY